jgi:hypothetical protein
MLVNSCISNFTKRYKFKNELQILTVWSWVSWWIKSIKQTNGTQRSMPCKFEKE